MDLKRKVIVGLIVVVFLSLVGVGIAKFYAGGGDPWKHIPTAEAWRGDFVVRIKEVGVFKALRETSVNAPMFWGWRRSLNRLVEEEKKVKAGDVVAELDTKELEQRLREQEARLKQAQADMDKNLEDLKLEQIKNKLAVETAEADLGLAKAEQEQAEREYERIRELVEAKLVPVQELASALLREKKAELSVKQKEYALESARQSQISGEKINQTNIEEAKRWYENVKKQVEDLKRQIEESTLKAPVEGIVIHGTSWDWSERKRVKVKEGDQVRISQTILSIPDLSEMLVKTQVPETEIDRVHLGQEVHIRADAYPDLKLTGKVTQVIQLAINREEAVGAGFVEKNAKESKVFEMTVTLDKSDSRLRPGTTAEVELIVKVVPDAVVVPFEAVFERDQKTYVYVAKDGGWEERAVKVGDRSGNEVVIKEGAGAGEKVMLKNPLLLAS